MKLRQIDMIIQGLQILAKYKQPDISAEHDVICAGPSLGTEVSFEDAEALDALGWHHDSELECWARFV